MLDTTGTMEENVKVLDLVSDTEEMAVTLDSEHEEGEISEDDDDVGLTVSDQHKNFPHHYPSEYHKERQPAKNSATSAVVIYDDRGRTAIFTSPRKKAWESGSYKRRGEPARRWPSEEVEKRRQKDDEGRKHQNDNGMSRKWQKFESDGGASGASAKKSKHTQQGLRRIGASTVWESDKVPSTKNKRSLDQPHRHNSGHKSHSSSSDSDSSYCSCSSYSSSSQSGSDSPVQRRGRGKENKRSGTATRARSRSPVKDTSSAKKKSPHKRSSEKSVAKTCPSRQTSLTQEKEGAKTSPTRDATNKLSKSYVSGRKSPHSYARHNLTTSAGRKTAGKACHPRVIKNKSKDDVVQVSDDESDRKSDDSQKEKSDSAPLSNATEVPLISSQKQLPRGSFGEMLLKKTLKGKLKVYPQVNKTSEKGECSGEAPVDTKKDVVELDKGMTQDCYTLDQEDEDELQLRLIALQSSLKVLSDVRREGRLTTTTESPAIDISIDLPQDSQEQPVIEKEMPKVAITVDDSEEKGNSNVNDMQEDLLKDQLQLQSSTEVSSLISQDLDVRLEEGNTKEEINLMLDNLSQSSTRSQPGSSITGLELELDAISTNRSYLDDGEDSTRQLATNIEEQLQREMKDLADSNQDPIDMDICDSSPGEDDENFDEDILKDVGEDISLDKVSSPDVLAPSIGSQANSYPVNTLDPGTQESFHHNSGNTSKSSSNNNFQIPVEWAYMMPPPPPPDQPPNDISNINNWCYDQNMYLQTMQSSYDSSEQYQHYNSYGTPTTSDWRLQHQHHPQWNESRAENYENVTEFPDKVEEKVEASVSPEEQTKKSTHTPEKEVSKPDSTPQEDLKDLPAEHYQAFMSAVLNQQNTNTNNGTQRNLIEVQLTKNNNASTSGDTYKSEVGMNGGAALQVNKRSRARRRKRERQKEKLKQLKQLKAKEKITKQATVTNDAPPGIDAVPSVSEEEDEDLLRAQLLIDLSRKKQQKQVEPLVESMDTAFSEHQMILTDQLAMSYQDTLDSPISGCMGHESTPPLSYSSSVESSPRPVNKTVLAKMHQQMRIRENSPTHIMKVNMRHGLSDIGGFGLDPKSSRYDFPVPKDSHTQKDMPKFKFPNIKPVIINLESDSDDEEEKEEEKELRHDEDEDPAREPQPSGSGQGDKMLSSSIDLLLKSMRNAPTKSGPNSKTGKQVKNKTLGKTSAVRTGQKSPHLDTTPNVVRHLSRTQQVEYRRLKEQLREKEMLQKKRQEQLLRQKVLHKKITTNSARFSPDSPQSGDNGGEASDGGVSQDLLLGTPVQANKSHVPTRKEDESSDQNDSEGSSQVLEETASPANGEKREVIFKETGGLQIQLPNVSKPKGFSCSQSKTNKFQGIDSVNDTKVNKVNDLSSEFSAGEDEDEEMLRMMVLKTLQKKAVDKIKLNDEEDTKSGDVTPNGECEKNEKSRLSSSETLRVVICQKLDAQLTEEKEEQDTEINVRKVVIEDQTDSQENNGEGHQEEALNVGECGEWMVLDEVLDEVGEPNGGIANNEELVVNTQNEEDNKDKIEIDDENVTKILSDCKESEGSLTRSNETECSVDIGKARSECKEDFNVMLCGNAKENQVIEEKESGKLKKKIESDEVDENFTGGHEKIKNNVEIVLSNKQIDEECKDNTQQVASEISKNSDKRSSAVEDLSEDGIAEISDQHSNTEKPSMFDNCNASSNALQVAEKEGNPKSKPNADDLSELPKNNDTTEKMEVNEEVISNVANSMIVDDSLKKTVSVERLENAVMTENQFSSEMDAKADKEEKQKQPEKETSMIPVSDSTKKIKTLSITVNAAAKRTSAIRIKKTIVQAAQRQINLVGKPLNTSGLVNKPGVTCKPVRTKRLLLLKRVEHEYTQKRVAMNEVISQLASLVHEATEEERQRQSLKSTITNLREKLNQMETQLDDKASKLKAKMARIRNLQTRITKDREEIGHLERKGEMLGKEELGSDYKLPKVLGSPQSKSKDHMRKKQLAHNIDALRQQIGQMYNKNQARLQATLDPSKKLDGLAKRRKISPDQELTSSESSASTCVSLVQNRSQTLVNPNLALNSKLLGSSSNTESIEKVKGTHPVNKTKVQVKRKILSQGANSTAKSAKTSNLSVMSGTKITIINEKAQEKNKNSPATALGHENPKLQSAITSKKISTTEGEQKLLIGEQTKSTEIIGKIDEMNMLCPYDLLGRCNDDSCSYQHVRDTRHLMIKAGNLQGSQTLLPSQSDFTERQTVQESSLERDSDVNMEEDKKRSENMETNNLTLREEVENNSGSIQASLSSSISIELQSEMNEENKDQQTHIDTENCENIIAANCDNYEKKTEVCENMEALKESHSFEETDLDSKAKEDIKVEEKVIEIESQVRPEEINDILVSDICLATSINESQNDIGISNDMVKKQDAFDEICMKENNDIIISCTLAQDDQQEQVETTEESLKPSKENEEPDQPSVQPSTSLDGNAELEVKVDEVIPDVNGKEDSETSMEQENKSTPIRRTTRKRNRATDLTSDIIPVSESRRRTRRSISKTELPEGPKPTATKCNVKKTPQREKSTPVKTASRRGLRKTKGGKR